MGKTMTAVEFVAYARTQVTSADVILSRHRPGDRCCACGRDLPCSVVSSLADRRMYYVSKIAIAETTVRLPVIVPQSGSRAAQSMNRRTRLVCRTLKCFRLTSFIHEAGRYV